MLKSSLETLLSFYFKEFWDEFSEGLQTYDNFSYAKAAAANTFYVDWRGQPLVVELN